MPSEPSIELKILDPRLASWGLPAYQSASAAAIDLHACIDDPLTLVPGAPAVLVPAGFAIFIRDPFLCAVILPRSGLGHKQGLVLGNGAGLIDADYQGPIMASLVNRNPPGGPPVVIEPGARIAQMMFLPVVRPRFAEVEAFTDETSRGAGGFGSTGGGA
jgi:dUTP pyrophosphatase